MDVPLLRALHHQSRQVFSHAIALWCERADGWQVSSPARLAKEAHRQSQSENCGHLHAETVFSRETPHWWKWKGRKEKQLQCVKGLSICAHPQKELETYNPLMINREEIEWKTLIAYLEYMLYGYISWDRKLLQVLSVFKKKLWWKQHILLWSLVLWCCS